MSTLKVHDNRHGPFSQSDHETLRINLSYVLHESSDADAINNMLDLQRKRLRSLARNRKRQAVHEMVGYEELVVAEPEVILTASIGDSIAMQDALATLPHPPTVVSVDSQQQGTHAIPFFGAPANLVLPTWPVRKLVIAVAILRPDDQSIEIVCAGPFTWPDQEHDVYLALERTILVHLDQWNPRRPLWAAPAEVLLPEVLEHLPLISSNTR